MRMRMRFNCLCDSRPPPYIQYITLCSKLEYNSCNTEQYSTVNMLINKTNNYRLEAYKVLLSHNWNVELSRVESANESENVNVNDCDDRMEKRRKVTEEMTNSIAE